MTGDDRQDPYDVLGVARQASGAEIDRAFRRAARTSHPDSIGTGSAERFQTVSDAYDLLRDPRRRAVYDRSHPLARPRTADARAGSVRYAAPGSQHLVLGQPATDIDEARSRRERDEIEEMFRLALSLLGARW
jgi:curved DNA-binding protein CbpA